jgi:hypothetical protein
MVNSTHLATDSFFCSAKGVIFGLIYDFFTTQLGTLIGVGLALVIMLFLPYLFFVRTIRRWKSNALWQKIMVLVSVFVGYYMGLWLVLYLLAALSFYGGPFFHSCELHG